MIGERDPRQSDKVHMGWIALLPCICCMVRTGEVRFGVQVAHIRCAYPGEEGWRMVGKAEKPHDWRTAPLCVNCHLNGKHAQHRNPPEEDWWAKLGIYPPDLCRDLVAARQAGMSGTNVIARYAAQGRKSRA